jgi:hypothetical protein
MARTASLQRIRTGRDPAQVSAYGHSSYRPSYERLLLFVTGGPLFPVSTPLRRRPAAERVMLRRKTDTMTNSAMAIHKSIDH